MMKILKQISIILGLLSFISFAMADNVYDVANIKVNVTAKDGLRAKEKGLTQAEKKAVVILFERLLGNNQKKRALNNLNKDTTSLLVKGFSVKNEQSSGTQYIAEITIKFRKSAVQRYLANIGADYSDTQSDTSLLVPIFTNSAGKTVIWSAQNPWVEALNNHDLKNTLVPLKIASPAEASLLATEQEVLERDENAIYQLASIVGESAEVIYAHLTMSETHASLKVSGITNFSKRYTIKNDNKDAIFATAAKDFVTMLVKGWRSNNISSKPILAKMKALVVFNDLDQWIDLRTDLSNIAAIDSFETDAMSSDGAFINVKYKGSIQELAGELATQGLSLYNLGSYFEIRG